MLAINYINNNENLLSLVFSYLNVKDLCQIRPVNKIYNKVTNNFNKYWKDTCQNYFSLNNENQRYINLLKLAFSKAKIFLSKKNI